MTRSEYLKAYYQANKEKIKAKVKLYRDTHKEHLKVWRKEYAKRRPEVRARAYWKYNLRQRYKITAADYHAMFVAQEGKCYICLKEEAKGRRLSVDHNHSTKRPRKLLCQKCNTLIGMAQECIPILQRAIAYLQEDHDNKAN